MSHAERFWIGFTVGYVVVSLCYCLALVWLAKRVGRGPRAPVRKRIGHYDCWLE